MRWQSSSHLLAVAAMTEFSEELVHECVGWVKHSWALSIEEGQITLLTEQCGPTCTAQQDGLGDYAEFVEMPTPVPVRLGMATDCPAYEVDEHGIAVGKPQRMGGYESGSHYIAHGSRCDCNWWPVLVWEPS